MRGARIKESERRGARGQKIAITSVSVLRSRSEMGPKSGQEGPKRVQVGPKRVQKSSIFETTTPAHNFESEALMFRRLNLNGRHEGFETEGSGSPRLRINLEVAKTRGFQRQARRI